MFYIITYDIGIERVNKVKKLTRQFLKWEQNSVVTGELSNSQIMDLTKRLKEIIDEQTDHIMIFAIRSEKFVERTDLGTPKFDLEDNGLFI